MRACVRACAAEASGLSHPIILTCLAEQQLDSDPRVQSSRLESIIIMPIQRIPRYKLLLEDLLKRTPDAHPDCNLLKVRHRTHGNT